MARFGRLTGRFARAWRRMRAGGGGWPAFWHSLLPLFLLAILATAAAACDVRPMGACQGAQLSGIDLRGRNLRGIDLTGADLRDAELDGADLTGAILRNADARRAGLVRAWLGHVILDGADLGGARLRRRDVAPTTSLSGTRMPDGTTCPDPSIGTCGDGAGMFRPMRRP